MKQDDRVQHNDDTQYDDDKNTLIYTLTETTNKE